MRWKRKVNLVVSTSRTSRSLMRSPIMMMKILHKDSGFGICDAPPIHEEDLNGEDEDSKERPLLLDLEGEYEEDGFPPMSGGLYPKEDDPLEEVGPMDGLTEGEYEEDRFPPMFCGLYPEEDDLWEEEGPTDSITDYNAVDDNLPSGVHSFNDEELGYVDFHGVDNILSNSHNDDCDEFYTGEENYMFTRDTKTNKNEYFHGM
jgi:hypothetical protein